MAKTDYRDAGVDIDAGNETVRRIKTLARDTYTPGVLSGVGSFGGLFALDPSMPDPVLVASADGVGTKLKVAFMTGVHRTIGVDLVNHCVNDILVQGARPLFFLDYLATGRPRRRMSRSRSCRASPRRVAPTAARCSAARRRRCRGFYAAGEYDVAGFIVGAVSRAKIIDGRAIRAGDVLIALPSTGLHTNGYSLARRIAFDVLGLSVDSMSMSWARRWVTRCCGRIDRTCRRLAAARRGWIKGMAHITGGGITENLPRVCPTGSAFHLIARAGGAPDFHVASAAGQLDDAEMFRAFNMGVGLILSAARSTPRSCSCPRLVATGRDFHIGGRVRFPQAR
jgi:phosphoribosylformylglycinamidine cyclo-ligase